MSRFRLDLAYDGSGFHGFADNPGVRTVAGTLNAALSKVLHTPIAVTCAGRTDAGVHARGQVVSFDAPADGPPPDAVQRAVNGQCGPEIVVTAAQLAATDFDARFSARWRRYRYTVLNTEVPDPFLASTAWWVAQPLELRSIVAACDPFVGEHDFTSFGRIPRGVPEASMVRNVTSVEIDEVGDGRFHVWIQANAFCHQMVRSIVGMLVDVGRGRRRAGEISGVLAARDRSRAANIAPPHGLCLWEVGY